MKLPIIMFFLVLATVIISGCTTDQNPVNKLCSMENARGELTTEQCVSDLSNVYDALKDRDSSKCSEISSAILRESCLQSVGKYSFLEWVRLAYGLSDSDIDRIFSSLTAPACSEDCSLASINITSVYIFTDPTYYVNQSKIEHQVAVHNNGACDIRLSSLKFFKGNETVCTENIDQILLKGYHKVLWNYDCNITCREFTKAVVTTECGQVVGEMGKDMMNCGTGVLFPS